MRNIAKKKLLEEIKTHILCPVTLFFFRKSCRSWDNVEKYCGAGRATPDNTLHAGHLRLQTHTQNMYYLLLFSGNNGYMKASQCYVICYTVCIVATSVQLTCSDGSSICPSTYFSWKTVGWILTKFDIEVSTEKAKLLQFSFKHGNLSINLYEYLLVRVSCWTAAILSRTCIVHIAVRNL